MTSQCSTILPSFEAEDVDRGQAAVLIAGRELYVRHHEIAFGDHALDVDVQVRVLGHESFTKSMNASAPSATIGLCCLYCFPTYFSTAAAGLWSLKASL